MPDLFPTEYAPQSPVPRRRLGLAALLIPVLAAAFWVIAAGSEVVATTARGGPAHVERAHYLMGTLFTIEAYHPDEAKADTAIEEAFSEIRRADDLMSHYRPESEISLLNREAATHPVGVQPDLFALLEFSRRMTEESAGAFDIATNSLTRAWQSAELRGSPLSEQEMAEAQRLLGAQQIGRAHV